MKTIYTRPICPACHALKAKLTREGVAFESIAVFDHEREPVPPGLSIARELFLRVYPDVKSFPFVVESEQ